MNFYIIIAMTTMLTFALVAAMTTTTAVYAADPQETPNTDDANRWGQTTSGAAEEDGQTNLGEHSSSQTTPRSGLGNAGQDLGLTESKHPSELAKAICTAQPTAPGC